MVRLFLMFVCVLSSSAQAFDFSELRKMADDPEAMQRMADEMAKAAECAKSADLEKMKTEGEAVHQKIKSLCERGDRKGAEKAAMDYAARFVNSPEYQQLKKCGETVMSYLPKNYMEQIQADARDAGNTGDETKHICDSIQ